uniref:BHLH domain-containing protein n=1 Tax=Hemiselmis andersenii TaxID=464988 RepID=A0A6U4TF02_HEMAN
MPGESSTTQAAQTQRRKESHNLTEQKRRQRINDKIAELKHILPTVGGESTSDKQAPDKATILSDAIEFIRKLHSDVKEVTARKSELERLNAMLVEENKQLKKAASA